MGKYTDDRPGGGRKHPALDWYKAEVFKRKGIHFGKKVFMKNNYINIFTRYVVYDLYKYVYSSVRYVQKKIVDMFMHGLYK